MKKQFATNSARKRGYPKGTRSATWATTHGHTIGGISATYRTWQSMKSRCMSTNPKKQEAHACYQGVKICARWLKFEDFLADMGKRPEGTTIDRLDSSKGYEPGNCRWATPKQQGENRAVVLPITFKGKTQNAEDWARELGMKPQTIRSRIERGWPVEKALGDPLIPHGHAPQRNQKLTPDLVRKIRAEYKRTAYNKSNTKELAAKYGVGPNTVWRIAVGQSWSFIK